MICTREQRHLHLQSRVDSALHTCGTNSTHKLHNCTVEMRIMYRHADIYPIALANSRCVSLTLIQSSSVYTLTSFRELPENCTVTAKQLAMVPHTLLIVSFVWGQERTEDLANNSAASKALSSERCQRGAVKGAPYQRCWPKEGFSAGVQ